MPQTFLFDFTAMSVRYLKLEGGAGPPTYTLSSSGTKVQLSKARITFHHCLVCSFITRHDEVAKREKNKHVSTQRDSNNRPGKPESEVYLQNMRE